MCPDVMVMVTRIDVDFGVTEVFLQSVSTPLMIAFWVHVPLFLTQEMCNNTVEKWTETDGARRGTQLYKLSLYCTEKKLCYLLSLCVNAFSLNFCHC